MVKKLTNVTSLSGNGMRDWLIQRATSVLMAAYIIFLLVFIMTHRPIDYAIWQGWIGMWTIITDYIKSAGLRLILQLFIIMALLLYFIWGLAIFWGN